MFQSYNKDVVTFLLFLLTKVYYLKMTQYLEVVKLIIKLMIQLRLNLKILKNM